MIGQQRGFHFINKGKNYVDLDFQLINNIIVIPIEINKKKLNFILDTVCIRSKIYIINTIKPYKSAKHQVF
jgi:hypothetical protein